MRYVRLKPFNGRNHIKKTYTVFGIKFEESKGWYKVDDDVAEYLTTVKQVDQGPDAEFSHDAFDVVDTLEEAKEIDEKERAQAKRLTADRAERKMRVHTPGRREHSVKIVSKTQGTREAVMPRHAHADVIEVPGEEEHEDEFHEDAVEEEVSETDESTGTVRTLKKKKKRARH